MLSNLQRTSWWVELRVQLTSVMCDNRQLPVIFKEGNKSYDKYIIKSNHVGRRMIFCQPPSPPSLDLVFFSKTISFNEALMDETIGKLWGHPNARRFSPQTAKITTPYRGLRSKLSYLK